MGHPAENLAFMIWASCDGGGGRHPSGLLQQDHKVIIKPPSSVDYATTIIVRLLRNYVRPLHCSHRDVTALYALLR